MIVVRLAGIVVAGGSGERFGEAGGKQLITVCGRPALSWSLLALDAAGVDELVVVCHPERIDDYRRAAIDTLELHAPVELVPGGDTRQASVHAGVSAVSDAVDVIIVHDGARPLVTRETVEGAVEALVSSTELDGVVVAHPLVDTVKVVDGRRVVRTPDRSSMWAVQTPQVFRADALREALASAAEETFVGTDDAALIERRGGAVGVFEGRRDNIKLTVPEDRVIVEAILRSRQVGGGC